MDISNRRDIQHVGYHVTHGTFWAASLVGFLRGFIPMCSTSSPDVVSSA